MKLFFLVVKNAFRSKTRAFLTILGIAIAVVAFGVLRTVVTAWYAGVDAAATDRLIVRHAVSFIFPMPYAYRDKIADTPGVEEVSFANWFGGTYIDQNQFFSRFAIDADTYFDIYPEYMLGEEELSTFKREQNSCVIGSDIASRYNLKVGDSMTLTGDIYPGEWNFIIRGIYQPQKKSTDASQMMFHWEYLNQRMLQDYPGRENQVGWYNVKIDNPDEAAVISTQIDELFANSAAETKTETEAAFTRSFISASGAILGAMNIVSFTIVGVIMLVLANTMMMSARERTREYAVLKTLGFSVPKIAFLIFGESLVISILGGALGLLLTFPLVEAFAAAIPKGWFPVFEIEVITIVLLVVVVLFIGAVSAIFPVRNVAKSKIADSLRFVG
ncbi:ABC transporter permease [bacterium]|nr:ABC transporter permease [bacterium]